MDPDPAGYCGYLLLLQLAPGLSADPLALAALITAVLALVLVSAILSGAEVALFTLDGATREALHRSGDRSSHRVLRLLEQPRALFTTMRLVGALADILAAVLAAYVTSLVGASYGWSAGATLAAQLVAVSLLLIVFGEVLPRLVAARSAATFSRRTSGLLFGLHRVFGPLSVRIAQAVSRRTHANSEGSNDLRDLADVGEGIGILDAAERDLLHAVVDLADTSVREVMVSRLDMVALPVTATLDEALDKMRLSGHSRLPLYVDHLDNILGVVFVKDLLPFLIRQPSSSSRVIDWRRVARPALFVPHGKRLDHLLKDFQARNTHIAIVVDEYGGTAGLVTMEDILEEIVGDIRDEHDVAEAPLFERVGENTVRFDARINLDEMNEVLGTRLDTERFDFETLGGLIFHLTGSVPHPGEELSFEGLTLLVESVDAHRIGTVLVTPPYPIGIEPDPVQEEELH